MATIALQSAATGLAALNTKLDVIANNLANVNTTGFKASRTNFQVKVEDNQGGGFAYTRAGNFSPNKDGELVLATSAGRRLEPNITIPTDAISVTIGTDGKV